MRWEFCIKIHEFKGANKNQKRGNIFNLLKSFDLINCYFFAKTFMTFTLVEEQTFIIMQE